MRQCRHVPASRVPCSVLLSRRPAARCSLGTAAAASAAGAVQTQFCRHNKDKGGQKAGRGG